jgi:methylphosphotriester-DNA--protein-cysteine methyltransferase
MTYARNVYTAATETRAGATAFHRAFRRWYGVTPQTYRAERRA